MQEADQETSARKHALRVGAQMLLSHTTVMECASYWVSEYSGGVGIDERDHFVVLVRQLLRQPLRLQQVYFHGVTRNVNALLKQPGLVRLCGDASHALPLEWLAEKRKIALLASLNWLKRPEQACYLSVNTEGLDGELQFTDFVYDSELQELYEPSFLVLALYAVHLSALYHTTGVQCDEDWLERHLNSLRPLHDEALDAEGALDACHCDGNPQLEMEKRARCRQELVALREALNTTDFEQAMAALQALWSEKALWCDARIDELC